MKKRTLPKDKFKILYDNTAFGGSGVEFFKKEIGNFQLTNEQIEILISELKKGISSALESMTAAETLKFLKTLKTKKNGFR